MGQKRRENINLGKEAKPHPDRSFQSEDLYLYLWDIFIGNFTPNTF